MIEIILIRSGPHSHTLTTSDAKTSAEIKQRRTGHLVCVGLLVRTHTFDDLAYLAGTGDLYSEIGDEQEQSNDSSPIHERRH